ncbi:MAG: cellulose binding domain-containing protein [Lachnospiraceae bacterium]|nr:cellulose binding domain-containing protein [Lachnospiraceae bacterium]
MKRRRRILGMILTIILCISSIFSNTCILYAYSDVSETYDEQIVPEGSIYEADGYCIETVITDDWAHAYNIRIIITNTSDSVIHNWGLLCTTEDKIMNLYNAKEMEYEGEDHFFKNLGWNQDIPVGESVSFGYTAEYGEMPFVPTEFKLVSIPNEVTAERYRVSYHVFQEWDTGAQAEILIENISNTDIEDWILEFDTELEITHIWNAQIDSHEGQHYIIRNMEDSQNIRAGETKVIGLLIEHSELAGELGNITMKEVTHDGLDISDSDMSHEEAGWIEVDCSDFERLSEDREIYWLDATKTALNGTLSNSEQAVSMNYIITDITDTVLFQGEIITASEWNIQNIGFVVGANHICIEAGYDDGSIARRELTIINYCEENMAAAGVNLGDSDGDGICDYYETVLGLDPYGVDSDGDSIADMDEIIYTGTDPCNSDTDGDGIRDDMEDEDGDGLTVSEELAIGTSPHSEDSDGDGFNDKEEITFYGTDPCNPDTDGDGLRDGLEPVLGFDPCNPDTDGDGMIDSEELVLQKAHQEIVTEGSIVTDVSVDMLCAGDINEQVSIYDTYGVDKLSSDVAGLIGVPVEIISFTDFDSAIITFTYDVADLGTIPEENLCMMWYDEENKTYQILEDSVVDTVNHTVSYTTTHFSTYLLVDKQIWYDTWRQNIDYSTYVIDNEDTIIHYDIIAAIDYTVSAEELEKERALVQNLIDGMLPGDRIKIVFYTNDNAFYTNNWYTSASSASYILSNLESIYRRQYGTNLNATAAYNGNVSYALLAMSIAGNNRPSASNQKMGFILHAGNVYHADSVSMQTSIIHEMDKLSNVQINAVTVGGGENSFLQEEIENRGGQIFILTSTEELAELLQDFFDVEHEGYEVKEFDYTDTDGDGLYDTYEINGMRVQNGKIVYTDPYHSDSDGDGISDFDEMGGVPGEWIAWTGNHECSAVINRMVSDPNHSRSLDDRYMLVDNFDYLPYNEELYNRIFIEDTGKIDADGNVIYGLSHIYQSNPDQLTTLEICSILSRVAIQCSLVKDFAPRSVTFLNDYMGNTKHRYFYYAASMFVDGQNNEGVKDNLYGLIKEATKYIREGETIYVTMRPDKPLSGISIPYYNLDWFAAVHEADGGAVAEISYDGDVYTMNLKYYVVDYYDWDEAQDGYLGIISDQEMYHLCRTGACRFYENWGIYETSISWTKETDINDVIFAIDRQLSIDAWEKSIEENLIITAGLEIAHWSE